MSRETQFLVRYNSFRNVVEKAERLRNMVERLLDEPLESGSHDRVTGWDHCTWTYVDAPVPQPRVSYCAECNWRFQPSQDRESVCRACYLGLSYPPVDEIHELLKAIKHDDVCNAKPAGINELLEASEGLLKPPDCAPTLKTMHGLIVDGLAQLQEWIDNYAIDVFGRWGAYFFDISESSIPRSVFDPKTYSHQSIQESDVPDKTASELDPRDEHLDDQLSEAIQPNWNPTTGRLCWGNRTIRQYRRGSIAKNVTAILNVFEEEGWPEHVLDPMPGGKDSQRLHDTVRTLNKDLKVIRFRSCGDGTGVTWERV
jgi:hypothetical protein